MIETNHNDAAEQYLLGKMSDSEQTDLEERYFSDEETFENVLAVEMSLLDAYTAGQLSAGDRKRFEERLVISPIQRERAKIAEVLIRYANRTNISHTGAHRWQSIRTALHTLFSSRSFLAYSLAAAAVIVIGGIVIWGPLRQRHTDMATVNSSVPISEPQPRGDDHRVGTTVPSTGVADTNKRTAGNEGGGELSSVTKTPPRPSGQNARPPEKRAIVSTILLQFGTTRGAGPEKQFSVPGNVTRVDIVVAIVENIYNDHFAVVETVEGRQIWRGKVTVSKKGSDLTATVPVPGRYLKAGDYIVAIKGRSDAGIYEPLAEYAFSLTRP